MNKYGKVYIGYEPGSEDWATKNGEYEVVEVEAKNYPEDPDNWDSMFAPELLDTIVEAGKKLVREVGFTDTVANCLYNIYWQKFEYEKPSKYYDGENLLVAYYDSGKKRFVTSNDYWNATDEQFDYYGNKVVYWAEMPEPPVQT